MSKFLEAIGLHAMTNREALMEELDAVDDATFELLVLDSGTELPETLYAIMCSECRKQHGGNCPAPSDDPCAITMAEWLSQPCRRERLLPEVKA